MALSIRSRMILAMNLLVAAVGSAVGYVGIEVATSQVAQRLVEESARNAAGLFSVQSLPLDSDALMAQSAKILGAQTASLPIDGGKIISSSLPPAPRAQLQAQIAPDGATASIVVLASKRYRVGMATVRRVATTRAEQQQRRLLVLMPEEKVIEAQRQVAGRIAMFTLLAILAATAVAFWLSTSIARPVRRLADRMDRLEAQSGFAPYQPPKRRRAAGPSELVRLTRSFDELLERLASARSQLDRSARLAGLGQLAASVAHELRNPLSGIKMNARVLADELAGQASADQSIDHIIREIDRMDLYLQELLSLASDSACPGGARPDAAGADGAGQGGADPSGPGSTGPSTVGAGSTGAGPTGPGPSAVGSTAAGLAQAAPPVEPVNLGEQADSIIKLLAGRCQHAGVTVHTDYSPAAGLAMADPGRIRQVILNLALNALDAMPHGGKLSIAVMPADADATDATTDTAADAAGAAAPAVRLEITDTGPGVQAAEGVDVFEPFITTKPQGTGLGLYICRRIIQSLHGQLGYRDSTHGATFWLELPKAPAN